MKKYLIFTSTVALIAFWAGVVTSNNNVLPFAIEEVMTISFLAVILMGYIFIEIEFTSDFSRLSNGSDRSNGSGYRKTLGTTSKPVYAQQLLDRKPTVSFQFLKKSKNAVTLLVKSAKQMNFRKRNTKSDVEKKISDMFADSNFKLPTKSSSISDNLNDINDINDQLKHQNFAADHNQKNISI